MNDSWCIQLHSLSEVGDVVLEGLTGGEAFAAEFIKDLVQVCADIMYDRYLDSRMSAHAFVRTLNLHNIVAEQEFILFDRVAAQNKLNVLPEIIIEDIEPITKVHETWRGYTVDIEKRPQAQLNSLRSSGKSESSLIPPASLQASVNIKKQKSITSILSPLKSKKIISFEGSSTSPPPSSTKKLKSPKGSETNESPSSTAQNKYKVFIEFPSEIIHTDGTQEIDRVEEQLRVLKQREMDLRMQKVAMEAARAGEKSQHKRMSEIVKNSEGYTYDFNGGVIGLNPAKLNNFPGSAVVLSHSVTTSSIPIDSMDVSSSEFANRDKPAYSKKQKSKNKNKSIFSGKSPPPPSLLQPVAATIAQPGTKTGSGSGNGYYQFPPSVEIFEKFSVNKGVTLIEGGKMKKGVEFSLPLSSIIDGRAEEIDKLRMLKKADYDSILMGKKRYQEQEDDTKTVSSAAKTSSSRKGLSRILNQLGNSFEENSLVNKPDRVIVRSLEMLNSLAVSVENDSFNVSQEVRRKSGKLMLAPIITRTPGSRKIDEFNRKILQNQQNWGGYDGEILQNLPIPISAAKISDEYKLKHVLGITEKLPKDRVFLRNKAATIKPEHLPSPPVGSTMGHGYLRDGFNPNRLLPNYRKVDEQELLDIVNHLRN